MSNQLGKSLKKVLTCAKCPKCHMMYRDTQASTYICDNCGYEEPTNFGIVREYLEEHGNASALEISRDTNVPVGEINSFLRHGRLEIPESSEVFIKCKRCGQDLRYGKYCPSCAQEMARELKGAFDMGTVGVVPKSSSAKMHVLHNARERRSLNDLR